MTGGDNSPVVCDSITCVSVGSIYMRSRYDEPLDSYQEADLERLGGGKCTPDDEFELCL